VTIVRLTIGLRKTEGRSQITHLHESVPSNTDQSFMAAIDFQP
jgi:hypothetical protein